MAPPFCHLHVHTDYSMLDGKGKPSLYPQAAKRRGMPSCGMTDHGNLSGAYEFYMACKEVGIAPNIGCEFYFHPNAERAREEKRNYERFHVVIIARNEEGYKTLVHLNDEAHRQFYGKPLLDRRICEALAYEEAENLVVLTGCAASILSQKVLGNEEGSAAQELQWWRETFPHVFVELQHHGTDFDRTLNRRLLKLARRYTLPWVLTNDPHYIEQEECDHHDALLAIQTGAKIDQEERFRFSGSGYHLRTRGEMVAAFREYGEDVWKPGIRTTAEVARDCALTIPAWDNRSWHIPQYRRVPKGRTSDEYLKRLTIQGLRDRDLLGNKKYVERAKSELQDIATVPHFADFLLITREIIQWAVSQGIWVGPGRGSTAGSLVGYAIGVHKVDSIRYKLLFERFLNPARPKMPDIDTDFSQARRDEVFAHIADEYGAENVLPVAAFQTMQVRGAFRKLATAMGMPYTDLNKFTKAMAEAWGYEDADDEEEEEHIRVEHLPDELKEGYPELVEFIEGILGTKSAISRHAAGVVIFDPEDPIKQYVPWMWVVSSKRYACQFDLKSAEKMGLMKQDILGLRTGDTIQDAVALIESRTGEVLDPDSWIPDEEDGDTEVYKMMASGRNAGVFQLEGGTMATGITKIKPHRFEDVVVCTSIYRKGPMLAGAPDRYIENKKAKTVKVLHPSLKPILEDTWGEMAYQEQMMQIAADVAGFDQGGVADLLAAVRFKDEKMMAPLRKEFIAGCRKVSHIPEKLAQEIWEMILAQSAYLFNRSHAVSYSLLSYQTGRLKRWWTLEYQTALLRTVRPKDKPGRAKRITYLADSVDLGITIVRPDINISDARMTCGGELYFGVKPDEDDPNKPWMRFGFEDIKGIGAPTAERIIQARITNMVPFKTVTEVSKALPPGLVKKLSESGCLESIGGPAPTDEALEEYLGWQFNDPMVVYRKKYADRVRLPSSKNTRVRIYGQLAEKIDKKTKNGRPYQTWRVRWSHAATFSITVWENANVLWDVPKGSILSIQGTWNAEFRNVAIGDADQVRVLKYARTKADKEVAA